MASNRFEKYIPKKRFLDFVRIAKKPFLIIVGIFLLITITALATNYIVGEEIIPLYIIGNSEDSVVKTTQGNHNYNPSSKSSSKGTSTPTKKPSFVDYSTLPSDILKSEMIKDLPDDAKVNFKFYNFNTGVRQWEKSFSYEEGLVKEGSINDADIKACIHSKYVAKLKTNDLCSVLNEAQINGDYYVETDKSTASLMWKYKGMMEYRDCLGI